MKYIFVYLFFIICIVISLGILNMNIQALEKKNILLKRENEELQFLVDSLCHPDRIKKIFESVYKDFQASYDILDKEGIESIIYEKVFR